MVPIIQVKNVSKSFATKLPAKNFKERIKNFFNPKQAQIQVINDISFNIGKGEIIGFIGPNGAGKSTTIKMMTGILFPSSGEISILNFNPQKQRKQLAMHIGTVFGQKPQLWYHLPAIDTFELFSKIYEIPKAIYQKRLKRLTKTFEVEGFINQPVRKLSLGQRMRLEMMASLLHNPKILFLDEPTIGLDIIVKKKIRNLIRKLNKEEKTTIILTSHDMEDVEELCKRLIIINKGNIVFDGQTKEINEKYLAKKRLTIILKNQVKQIVLPGTKTLFKGTYKHALEVDTSKQSIQKIMQQIVKKYQIEDITIHDPPIEEIIEEIYRK